MKPFSSVVDLVHRMQTGPKNPKALNSLKNGIWQAYSTETIHEEVRALGLGLVALAVKPGDRIGILANPSPLWMIADLAIMSIGCVTVPLFANQSEEKFLFEIQQTELKYIFVSFSESPLFTLHSHIFNKIIYFDEEEINFPNALSCEELSSLGKELDTLEPERYSSLTQAVTSETLATIVYSSGSTGTPKGIELTHKAVVAVYHTESFHLDYQKDSYLNILPLAHIFGRALNLFIFSWGVSIYFCPDIKLMGSFCQTLHPTILVVVPRLLEKLYLKMVAKVEQAGFLAKTIGLWAFHVANQEESLFKAAVHPILDKIIYSTLREALGGQVRIIICGGAYLDKQLCHFFNDIGLPIYQGWGLTEASTISVNTPAHNKIGTVGLPMVDNEVKVSPSGELLIKGNVATRGYYRDPDATKSFFDEEGWFHTGDFGSIDSEGYITILGRLRDIYKTSTGENINPVPIEQALCKAPLIDMALVVGHNRKFVSCLLFPDISVLHRLKASHEMNEMSDEEFVNSDLIKKEMRTLLQTINQHLDEWERVKAYRFILKPLTVESGELTPSMKISRKTVLKNYSSIIDQMYTP